MSGKSDFSASVATVRSILQSSFFLGFNAYSVILVFCLSRRFLGKFYYVVAAHLPAIIGSYMSIQLERKSRRPALSFYVANIASETLWNKVVNKGWFKPIPCGEVLLFGLSTSSLLYLMHRNGFGKDPVSFGFRFLLGKEFIQDPLKSRRSQRESYTTTRDKVSTSEEEDSAVESGKTSPTSSLDRERLESSPNQPNRRETWSVNDVINIETSDKQKVVMKRRRSRAVFERTINDPEVTTSETESLEGSQEDESLSVDSSVYSGCQSQEEEDGIKTPRLKSTKKSREKEEREQIILTPLTDNHCLINGQRIINFCCPHSISAESKEKDFDETTKQTKEFEEEQSILRQYMKGIPFASCFLESFCVKSTTTSDAPLTSTSSSPSTRESLSSSLDTSASSPLLTTSCLKDCIVVSLRNFLIAYAGHSTLSLFMRPKSLTSHPIKSLMNSFVRDSKSLKLAMFLGSFTALFKTSNCFLWNLLQPSNEVNYCSSKGASDCLLLNRKDHYAKLTFLSGLIASSSMVFYPSSTTAQYMMWKLIETLYFLGVKSGRVKYVDFTMSIVYAVSTAQLFYVAVMEPNMMRKSYTKFLNRVTRGSFALLNRNIIDIFGTHASSGYEYYEPNLQLDHTSDKFKESVLVWMI
jgi:hypothetical protein